MIIPIVTSTGLALFIGIQWVLRFLFVNASLKNRKVLTPESKPLSEEKPPQISVIVAAKEEEESIEKCVNTLLNQDYSNFELIVIDDRSEDNTLSILKKLKKHANGKLKVLHVSDLPKGWLGKPHAMQQGVKVSSGEWLCFLDADCEQTSNNTLSVAMQEAKEHQSDFLTITPTLEMKTAWEYVIQPTCVMALLSWFRPERVNNPQHKTAYANGAFMLMKRSCYQTIGKHFAVKEELNEDIIMAQRTKAAGLSLRMVENEGLYQTRMYDTFKQAWHGWSRIFTGALQSTLKLSLTAIAILVFTLLPWICLAVAIGMRLNSSEANIEQWNIAVGMWGVVALLSYLPSWRFYSVLPLRKVWALAYPVGALVTMIYVSFALVKHWGLANTLWRGSVCQFEPKVTEAKEVDEVEVAA